MDDVKYTGGLILNSRNEILLQRKDIDYKKWPGFWTTFGGKIEETEKTPLDALLREVREETGVHKVNDEGKQEYVEGTGLNLFDVKLFERSYIDESKYGDFGQPNPSLGFCDYFAARFDGDLSKIVLGEGAGFSLWSERELPIIKDTTFTYVYEVIQRF